HVTGVQTCALPISRTSSLVIEIINKQKMKVIINTDKAPAPIGPYNQSVKFGNLLFTSGQIAINPKTGDLVVSGIEEETTMVMENLKAVLEEAGATFEDV